MNQPNRVMPGKVYLWADKRVLFGLAKYLWVYRVHEYAKQVPIWFKPLRGPLSLSWLSWCHTGGWHFGGFTWWWLLLLWPGAVATVWLFALRRRSWQNVIVIERRKNGADGAINKGRSGRAGVRLTAADRTGATGKRDAWMLIEICVWMMDGQPKRVVQRRGRREG